MPRVKRGFKRRRHMKKVMRQAKGYVGGRGRLVRQAMQAVDMALQHAYKGRKLKKRAFRGLWQTRIAAAVQPHGLSYSKLMGILNRKNCKLDRKMLSELALNHPEDFRAVVEWAKAD